MQPSSSLAGMMMERSFNGAPVVVVLTDKDISGFIVENLRG